MEFNKDNIDEIRKELDAVLRRYGNTCEMGFKLGNIKYSPKSYTVQLTVCCIEEGIGTEQTIFEINCRKGIKLIPKEWYGKICNFQGEKYRICAINNRARKYPMELKRLSDGRSIKTTVDNVMMNLENEYINLL